MKILHLCSSDLDGGAAKAAFRLMKAQRRSGLDSRMLVQSKRGDDASVTAVGSVFKGLLRRNLDQLRLTLFYKNRTAMFSPASIPLRSLKKHIAEFDPDVVHLHWVCNGFFRIENLAEMPQPVVWTMHDMWPMTGGCHYAGDCQKYLAACGQCPILPEKKQRDISHKQLLRKKSTYQKLNLGVVAPSKWLAECAQKSSLLSHLDCIQIENCIDTDVYRPIDRDFSRQLWRLPPDKKLILFGAQAATTDLRKGIDLLVASLNELRPTTEQDIEVVIFGSSKPKVELNIPFPVHYMGNLNDDVSIATLYSAVDVLVVPSREDNLPNTLVEASACGVPSVGFDVGGVPDIIEHKVTGYVVKPFDIQGLTVAISWVIDDSPRQKQLGVKAREKALLRFSEAAVVKRYSQFYSSLSDC